MDHYLPDQSFDITVTWARDSAFTTDVSSVTKTLTPNYGNNQVYTVIENLEIPFGYYVRVNETCGSYVQEAGKSWLKKYKNGSYDTVLASYTNGEVFCMDRYGEFHLNLYNRAEWVSTMYFQKVWIDRNGELLDFNANTATDATAALGDVVTHLEVSADNGVTWTRATKKITTSAFVPESIKDNDRYIVKNPTAAFGTGG